MLDLWSRVYKYPLEYLIEALAPTSEMDFDLLPVDKQKLYKAIQTHHVGASPDGPWFFIIARNNIQDKALQLIGITDTAMLRPQVFALQEGEVQIGLICSEKQAIDATLISLEREDARFRPIADKYWNARGGSYTDGGSFIFSLVDSGDGAGGKKLICTDKFGKVIETPKGKSICDTAQAIIIDESAKKEMYSRLQEKFAAQDGQGAHYIFDFVRDGLKSLSPAAFRSCIETISEIGQQSDDFRQCAIDALTLLADRRYDTGAIKRSSVLHVIKLNLDELLASIPVIGRNAGTRYCHIDFETRTQLRPPQENEKTLVIDAEHFEPEGNLCDAVLIVAAYKLGWKKFIVYKYRGQRFTGCGFGPATHGVRIDVYGSSGDYLASGIDGMEIHVHGNAQDQLCQIFKEGKLVVYGDVGQTFMYGAKGGTAYILGNAAGRPLINAVGKPRVVINGTALDYLAESFMAGDPLTGGGFVVLNGIGFSDEDGSIKEYDSPYPGSNIFSLASGGAIYVRDPHRKLVDEQLNGGEYAEMTDADWNLILPYLQENENLFGISLDRLLTVGGAKKIPADVYRKIRPKKASAPKQNDAGLVETCTCD
jgi:glutamate synthase domain-containing protein 3